MISYSKLLGRLSAVHTSRTQMGRSLGLSPHTVAKIAKGEPLSPAVLRKISVFLACAPNDLYEVVSENPLLQLLRDEKSSGLSGGLYRELLIRMTCHSGRMGKSALTEEQVRRILETRTISGRSNLSVDDILETVHHFTAIDTCIDAAEDPLSEELIRYLHYLLKYDTRDASLEWFALGAYKRRVNTVCGHATASPRDVPQEMRQLLADYLAKEKIALQDILEFHVRFEKIHPFQDGNGRIGRLIAFKECLKHHITPFLLEASRKDAYYRGLTDWDTDPGILTELCRDGQDAFSALLKTLHIEF